MMISASLYWALHHPLLSVSHWLASQFGIDLLTMESEKIQQGAIFGSQVAASAYWEFKRRHAGKRAAKLAVALNELPMTTPAVEAAAASMSAPIKPSAIAAAVKRATDSVKPSDGA